VALEVSEHVFWLVVRRLSKLIHSSLAVTAVVLVPGENMSSDHIFICTPRRIVPLANLKAAEYKNRCDIVLSPYFDGALDDCIVAEGVAAERGGQFLQDFALNAINLEFREQAEVFGGFDADIVVSKLFQRAGLVQVLRPLVETADHGGTCKGRMGGLRPAIINKETRSLRSS